MKEDLQVFTLKAFSAIYSSKIYDFFFIGL